MYSRAALKAQATRRANRAKALAQQASATGGTQTSVPSNGSVNGAQISAVDPNPEAAHVITTGSEINAPSRPAAAPPTIPAQPTSTHSPSQTTVVIIQTTSGNTFNDQGKLLQALNHLFGANSTRIETLPAAQNRAEFPELRRAMQPA